MKVLVLAGTREARVLCAQLAEMPGVDALASLAGVTSVPEAYAVLVRTGGFGGADGLADFLADNDFDILIDASHPFALNISKNAVGAALRRHVYFTILRRPAWPVDPVWHQFENPRSAIAALPENAVGFLALGAQSAGLLTLFPDKELYLRMVDQPQKPFPNLKGGFILGKAMGGVDEEEALFAKLGVTHLVCRNSGGSSGMAKLSAAKRRGIAVHMVARPAETAVPLLANVQIHEDPEDIINFIRRIQINHCG